MDRVDSEERMRAANDQLAHAAMIKDQFLAGMSHELRTPLNSILGVSEALQEGVYGELTDRQLMALKRVEDGGRHLLALINDILDLARLEAGETVLDFQPVGARSVCEASLSFVREQAAKKGLSLTWRVQDQVDFFIGDERRVKQILVNLLSNAVKFTEEGGRVSMTATGDVVRSEVTFTVQDSGIGISPEEVVKLFQPFRQLDSSLARQYNGAGLGLSIVKHMAELHGGRVSVASALGQGSCFSITLPWQTRLEAGKGAGLPAGAVAPAAASKAAPVRGSTSMPAPVPAAEDLLSGPAWGGGPGFADSPSLETTAAPALAVSDGGAVRALVVEDSQEAAEQISRYLKEQGLETTVAGTGEQALASVMSHPPQVIFLDIMLPGIVGWEVLAKLKANPRSSHIPVIVLSVVDERQRSLRSGAAGYLMKPVTRLQLESILSVVLERPAGGMRPVKEPPARPAEAKTTLLLAEDNEENIAIFSEYLEANGYTVAVARHGAEALEMMRQITPALILMDVQMPVMDGLVATRRLRENPATTDCPIVCLTAMAMPGDERKCLEAGADAYLSKPVRLRELLRAVRRWSRAPQGVIGERALSSSRTARVAEETLSA